MTLTILMAGIGIGTVVLEGSRRSVETDQSVSAYYMADSGVERQLYEVRKNDKTAAQLAGLNENYPNQGSWSFFGGYATTTQKTYDSVATSSFEVVDLFNPDNVSAAGVARVELAWTSGADCGAQTAQIEAGYSLLDFTGATPFDFKICRANLVPADPNCAVAGQTMTLALDPTKNYRVRLRALTCTASNLAASTFDAVGLSKGFPGDVTVSAEGTYGKATQKIAVTMPKTNVLSGVFSFVIFSECTLIKGLGTPVCPP